MRASWSLALLTGCACAGAAQIPLALQTPATPESGDKNHTIKESHRSSLSKWARKTKEDFLAAASADRAHDWTIVVGNEAGDTDSMVSALAFAWQLSNSPKPKKAVAMLQTSYDAIDLRPENTMALEHARMEPLHGDMLSMDELPVQTWDLWHRIKGLVLVDHNKAVWRFANTSVLGIIDHHEDRNHSMHADPRIIKMVGSTSSLVTLEMKRRRDEASKDKEKHKWDPIPTELADLLLHTIAIDTKAKKKKLVDEEKAAVEYLWPISSYKDKKMKKQLKKIYHHMKDAQDDLGSLSVRDFLRRDYKGGPIKTSSEKYKQITVGYANVPILMDEMIDRTPEGTTPEFFAVARTWTGETGQDVSIILTKEKKDGNKIRELCLIVARGWSGRIDTHAADSLFNHIKNEIEKSDEFQDLETWLRPDGKPMLSRRAVFQRLGPKDRPAIYRGCYWKMDRSIGHRLNGL